MNLFVGFGQADITPPVGTHKIGWLKDIVSETILTPLCARAAVFQKRVGPLPDTDAGLGAVAEGIAVIQLDTLFIGWPEVVAIRQGIEERYGFPGRNVMVAATHNHAGPAVTAAGDVPQDEIYVRFLVSQAVDAFAQAMRGLSEAELGWGRAFEWQVAHNRRVVMRDGTVRTHGSFDDAQALCLEGPIDPEVGVLTARNREGELLGGLVNFACHPTHHGGDTTIDAGFPGILAQELQRRGCPATLFLNGAAGNTHTSDPRAGGRGMSAQEAGTALAEDAWDVMGSTIFHGDVEIRAARRTIDLPFRLVTEEEIAGRAHGAQRFIDPAIYERAIPALVKRMRQQGTLQVEIQGLFLGDSVLLAVPGEYFCEYGLRIKEAVYPKWAWIVSCANGRVGYIPTREAFRRGGYETTFGPTSMLAPEAGDLIAEAAVELIREASVR